MWKTQFTCERKSNYRENDSYFPIYLKFMTGMQMVLCRKGNGDGKSSYREAKLF